MAYAYLQQRSTLSASQLPLEIQVLQSPVECTVLPNAPNPIPEVAPMACREGVGETPADAWYTNAWKRNKPQQPVDEVRVARLEITHESWPLTLCSDS